MLAHRRLNVPDARQVGWKSDEVAPDNFNGLFAIRRYDDFTFQDIADFPFLVGPGEL
jgi:hypothetical protein